MTRCTSVDINFAHAFSLQGVDGLIGAGIYRIDTEEEPIDGLRTRRHSSRDGPATCSAFLASLHLIFYRQAS